MAFWRNVASLLTLLAISASASAQTHALVHKAAVDDCFRYSLDMHLTGDLQVGKTKALKLSASATHVYPECVLVIDESRVKKVARVYETAQALIVVGAGKSSRSLRPDRTLIVVQRPDDDKLTYCPKGSLTREELELTDGHLDTLTLAALLPTKEVKVGDAWKINAADVQTLCHFDGLNQQDLQAKLVEVKDGVARVKITGQASGIELGALVKLDIQASYLFDLKKGHIVSATWKQRDERGPGPVSPASTFDIIYEVKCARIDRPSALSPIGLISVPEGFEPPPVLLQIIYEDPEGRYRFLHEREWHTAGNTGEHLVLRYIERGDFIAQASLVSGPKRQPGDHLSPDAFKQLIAQNSAWQQDQELQVGTVPSAEAGRWTYRVSALGALDGMRVLQNFFVIASPAGQHLLVTVTLSQVNVEALGSKDLVLIGNIDLPPFEKAP